LRAAITRSRAQPWLVCVVVLIALTTLSPRIPLDIAIPGRTFDLRLADLLLAGVLPVWLISVGRNRLMFPLWLPVVAYCAIATIATVIAVGTLGLDGPRGALYLGKEFEYFGAMAIVATTTRTPAQRWTILVAILVVGLFNALWFGIQLIVQQDMSLLSAERPLSPTVFLDPQRLASYGPHLAGESSPFSVGGFFMVVFTACAAWISTSQHGTFRLSLIGIAFIACLALSQSRVSLVGAVLGVIALVVISPRPRRLKTGTTLSVVLVAGLALSTIGAQRHLSLELIPPSASPVTTVPPTTTPPASPTTTALQTTAPSESAKPTPSSGSSSPTSNPSVALVPDPDAVLTVGVARRFGVQAVVDSIQLRVELIWAPLFARAIERPLLGYGKGSLGALPGLNASEAHMAFLRAFVETGILGLGAFLILLASVLRVAASLSGSRIPEDAVMVGRLTLALTVAMVTAAVVQDAFTAVLLNQTYWILVGLASSACWLRQRSVTLSPIKPMV